jgi:hypothetical protein
MSLILSERAYLGWVERQHPHVPSVAEIEAVLRAMAPEELGAARTRAQILTEYGQVGQAAISALQR